MPYVTQHHVSHNGRDYEPGEEIAFEDKDAAAREALLDCKAIREVEGRPAKAPAAEKALADMTKAELEAVVLAEIGTALTNVTKAELVAAIEAKRVQAAADAAADGGDAKE